MCLTELLFMKKAYSTFTKVSLSIEQTEMKRLVNNHDLQEIHPCHLLHGDQVPLAVPRMQLQAPVRLYMLDRKSWIVS